MKIFSSSFCAIFAFLLCGSAFAAPRDTVTFWAMPNGPDSRNDLEKTLRRFTQETRIPVRLEIIDWSEAFARLNSAFESRNTPDILQTGSTWISFFADKKYLAQLNAIAPQVDSLRFLRQSMRPAHIDGKPGIYAFPWFLDIRALFANKRVTDSLGIRAEDLVTEAQFRGILTYLAQGNFTTAKGLPLIPFGLPGKDDWTGPQALAPFLWSEGGDYIRKENGRWRSALLDSASLRGIARYVDILRDTLTAPNSLRENSAQNAARFTTGEQVFLFGTSEILRKMDIPESEHGFSDRRLGKSGLAVFSIPGGKLGSKPFFGGSYLAIPASAKHTKSAQRLLLFLLRADNLNRYTHGIGFLPPDESVLNVWAKDSRYSGLVKDLEHGQSFPNIPEWGAVEKELIAMTNDIGAHYRHAQKSAKNSDAALAALLIRYDGRINAALNIQDTTGRSVADIAQILREDIPTQQFAPHKAIKVPEQSAPAEVPHRSIFQWILAGGIFGMLILTIILSKTMHNLKIKEKKRRR